jgi:hypothetical protein
MIMKSVRIGVLVGLVVVAGWAQAPFQGLEAVWGAPQGGESLKDGLKGYVFKKA